MIITLPVIALFSQLWVVWTFTFRPLQQLSKQSSILFNSSPKFKLCDYTQHSLIESSLENINAIFINHDQFSSIDLNKNIDFIILLDFSDRSLDDINMINNFPLWDTFKKKLKSSQSSLLNDKFLYIHDVGIEHINKMAMSRIPFESYQKLNLCRQFADSLQSSNVVVMMPCINEYNNDMLLYYSMVDCIVAAFQTNRFNLPSFKSSKLLLNDKKQSISYEPLNIYFVKQTLNKLEEETDTDVSLPLDDSNTSDSNIDHIEDDANSAELNRISNRIRDIERAMTKPRNVLESLPVDVVNDVTPSTTSSSCSNNDDMIEQNELLHKIKAITHGTNIARSLAMLPPNVLHPKSYTEILQSFCNAFGWQYKEWTPFQMKEAGCGAFYAVCAANCVESTSSVSSTGVRATIEGRESSDRLVKLFYEGSKLASKSSESGESSSAFSLTSLSKQTLLANKPLVLVGKGVCYDTGGINLKSANSMKTMKHDMAGSSVALGVFFALAETNFPHDVECWLPIVENNVHVSTSSSGSETAGFRPDDVVTAVTGDTIEVVHSDAEGRMLLADTLAIASRKTLKSNFHGIQNNVTPKLIIDFATLTGTCISSLTSRYIGAFTNKRELSQLIIKCGETSGERIWPMPLDADFEEDLQSDLADVLQCRQPVEGDHIYAAAFLNKFVNPIAPWIHMDLSSSYRSGGLGHVATDITGAGVRVSVEIIQEFYKTTTPK